MFVISGTPEHDGRFEREARDQLQALESQTAFSYLTDVPVDELIARVKGAPTRSVIFYVRQSQDVPLKKLDGSFGGGGCRRIACPRAASSSSVSLAC